MDDSLTKIRHDRSRKDFPFLKLEDDEYVEFAFSRAKTFLFLMYGGLTVGLAVILLAFLLVLFRQSALDEMGRNFLYIILTTLLMVVLIASSFVAMLYRGNRLFVTNKHAIQLTMKSPVSKSENIIDLVSIEDASYSQSGIVQTLCHFGTFRLSTIGDETTYTFPFVTVSSNELKAVSKLLTEAKKADKKD